MCTAATLKTKDLYFGRTLDNEFSYFEEVTIVPRNFVINFRHLKPLREHYAIIGMAYNKDDYPLFYDATNEKGLSIAGLNFVGNAYYRECSETGVNVAQFELIPFILGQCATVDEAWKLIETINIVKTPFSEDLPAAQLHWIIADETRAITLESTKEGINVYENPLGVLTNNPPFPEQLENLSKYKHLSNEDPKDNKGENKDMRFYSKGIGAIGLPGDLSSMSRFVRVAFTKGCSVSGESEEESVAQFFRVLGSVFQTRGSNKTEFGLEITVYLSCCNASRGIYYYSTYENPQITGVNMHNEDLNGTQLIKYPLVLKNNISMQN